MSDENDGGGNASTETDSRRRRAAPDRDAVARQRLIEAARPLFARNGYKAVSIRAIADAAGVNSALIGYHFGGKEALFSAVYKASAEPVNHARLALFRELSLRGEISARDVVEAWVHPMLAGTDGVVIADLALAMTAGDALHYDRLASETYQHVNERFLELMERALPGVSRATLVWRLHFLIGAVLVAARDRRAAIVSLSRGECDPADRKRLVGELVDFATGGFETESH